MRKPAPIKAWLSPEALQTWVREADSHDAYQKRLAVWLTFIGPYPADPVATLLGIFKQAVWLWVGHYNQRGPEGLERAGRSGRRRAFLSWEQEEAFLADLEEGVPLAPLAEGPGLRASN